MYALQSVPGIAAVPAVPIRLVLALVEPLPQSACPVAPSTEYSYYDGV